MPLHSNLLLVCDNAKRFCGRWGHISGHNAVCRSPNWPNIAIRQRRILPACHEGLTTFRVDDRRGSERQEFVAGQYDETLLGPEPLSRLPECLWGALWRCRLVRWILLHPAGQPKNEAAAGNFHPLLLGRNCWSPSDCRRMKVDYSVSG